MSVPSDFEAAMRLHGPKIYTLAVRLTGNSADGQDLAQEAFVKAFQAWNRFRGEADAGTWFYRICVNCWKNRVRYESRREFFKHDSIDKTLNDGESPIRELAGQDAPLSQPLEEADEKALLQKGLDSLEPEDRAILMMREVEGKSYEEIAALLEVPIGTVRSRLSRSREKLRQLINKEQPHE